MLKPLVAEVKSAVHNWQLAADGDSGDAENDAGFELAEVATKLTTAIPEAFAAHLDEAERKAFDSLARYKFQMFGYWAAIWVHLNHISGLSRPSPFRALVHAARIQNVGYGEPHA